MAASTEVGIRLSLTGANEVAAGTDRVGQSFGRMQGSARSASEAALSLRGALGGIASVATVAAFVKLADSVTTLRTQLLLATGSAKQAGVAFNELYQIAQQGRVSFTELGTTYAAVARAGNELGVSQSRLLTVTQSISQAMTIGGGSAQAMQAALVQLGQGLSSGVLRGEELNSIMEQTPRLAKAIADGMGVPIGELRKLGEAGQLTAQQVIAALEKAGPQLAREMESATLTVGQAMTLLGNSTTKLIGDMDQASGASAAMARAVQGIATAMDSVGSVIRNNETAFSMIANGLAGAATVAGLAALARGIYLAATAVSTFGAAWLATPLGPIVAAIAAVTGAIYGLQAAAEKASKSEYGIKADLIITEEQIAKLESRGNRLAEEGRKRLDTLREQRAKLQAELALVANAGLDTRAEDARFGAAAGAARERDKVANEYQALRHELSGVNKDFYAHLQQLDAARQAGLLSEAQYVSDVKDLIAKEGGARKDAADKATNHLAAQKKAAAEFLADLQAQAAQAEAAAGQRKNLTEEQKALAKVEEMVREGRVRDKDIDREAIAAAARRIDLAKASAAAYAEQARAYQASLDTTAKENTSLAEQNEKLRQSNALIGLTKKAVADLEDARMANAIAMEEERLALANLHGATTEELALMKQRISLLKERRALMRETVEKNAGVDAEREAVNAAKEATAEWQRGWSETDRLAREVFTTWATDGSNAAQKIGDTLKKALLSAIYEATLKPLVFQLYTNLAGGSPGGALGAVNSAGSLLGGSGSSGLSSTFSALGGNLASGFKAGLGAVFGESGTLGGLSAGTTALGAGNILGGLGTLAGTALPWLAGASLLQSLTSSTITANGSALLANLGGGTTQGVAIRSDFTQSSSGIFSGGTTHNSDWKDADAQVTQFIQQQVKLVTDSARAYGTALGLPVDSLDSFKKQIEVSLTGLDAAGVQKALQGAIDGFANDLVSSSFGDALKDVAREGETSAQTLTRLSTDLAGVNQVFDSVGHHLLDVSVSGAAAASGLVQAAGGLSNLQSQLQSMYAQLASAQQDLADANRNAYDLMVESQDQANKVLGNDSGGGGGGGGGGSNALAEAVKYLADLKTGIKQWIDKLNSTQEGGLGLQAQRDSAWAALQTQLVLARGGDRTALSGITGYASTYIGAVQGTARTSAEEQIAIGRVKAQLSKLPDQVPPEKLIVDAINSNGGSGGAVATAVKSLGNKLTAELTVSARSEIVKMIEFVTDTDKLPHDLKQLALASADTMTKTVSFITGSKLTEENKQLALGTSSQLTKTINYGLGLDIPDEYKRIALKASDSIEKTISYTARNVLDPKQAALALMADNTIVKTLELAAGRLDPEALKVAYAQSETIRKMIEASGGVLTEDQQMLLNNVAEYNKQVNLQVHLDEDALTAAEDFLQTRFNTLDIKTVLKANDPTTVLRDFINSQISGGINGIAVFNVYQAAKTYGFTQQDIANAMGRSLAEVEDIFGQYGIPKFAVGADYIPQDMLAVVHKGEQIVPAAYNPNAAGNQRIDTGALERRIEALQADARAAQATMAALMSRLVKLNEKWDGDGLPETRSVAA